MGIDLLLKELELYGPQLLLLGFHVLHQSTYTPHHFVKALTQDGKLISPVGLGTDLKVTGTYRGSHIAKFLYRLYYTLHYLPAGIEGKYNDGNEENDTQHDTYVKILNLEYVDSVSLPAIVESQKIPAVNDKGEVVLDEEFEALKEEAPYNYTDYVDKYTLTVKIRDLDFTPGAIEVTENAVPENIEVNEEGGEEF